MEKLMSMPGYVEPEFTFSSESCYDAQGSINILDEVLNARDALFDRKLSNGLKEHRDFIVRLSALQ